MREKISIGIKNLFLLFEYSCQLRSFKNKVRCDWVFKYDKKFLITLVLIVIVLSLEDVTKKYLDRKETHNYFNKTLFGS